VPTCQKTLHACAPPASEQRREPRERRSAACHASTLTYSLRMEIDPRPDKESSGEASLGAAQSSNPPDDPEMIDPTADPLDTDVEDADLFLGWDDTESE
jgi:hypothetical protein